MDTVKTPAEQRVVLRNVSWETYDRLVAEREERPVPRFFYDRGVLEIVSPSNEHEAMNRIIASLVKELAVEYGTDVSDAGHTTFRREDLERGFEPDSSFYFSENAERVRGLRDIDLLVEPPPDLVVEVDLTSHSLSKLPIYARIGVNEVWRYAGGSPEILALNRESGEYETVTESRILPSLTTDTLARLTQEGLTKRYPDWARGVRDWARHNLENL